MKIIEVMSKGKIFSVKVDDADYHLLSRHKWYILFTGKRKRPYAFTRFYTENDKKNGKTFLMHHLIMGTSGAVDHRDNDSLNNQTDNLRVATYQQNGWNKGKPKAGRFGKCSSQYKGVSKCIGASGNVYWRIIVKLTKKGETPSKFFRAGPFTNEVEAAIAYNKEIVKLRPGFGWENPIPAEYKNLYKSIG